jgi:D-sedoheptulose 7-phosphate isomerase
VRTDTSVLTAIANDFSYDAIFERQVQALVSPGDCLWAFSTSGTSENILSAARLARQQGGKVLAFTGRKDSPLEKLADVAIVADAPTSAAAQEIHQLAYHILCDILERRCCE